ncbi:MAG: hypothetical protein M0P43_03820 [Arcobacteraceae bacterium]|nr:hypothetical protein [Arcobacteraceae bacterium]MDY0328110.1 hypothetical protein [Arcobacteraceae bacterium]
MIENNHMQKAKKVLERNKHYEFFKTHLYDFSAINSYKGFKHLDLFFDKDLYDRSNKPHYNLSYSCWFVVVCVLNDFGDDWSEFENDRDRFIYDYEHIKKYNLSRVFCELKDFFLAYKIICKNTKDTKTPWYENVPQNLEF